MQERKAYYIDTDNICNFKREHGELIKDINKNDLIFLFYTIEGNKSRALNTLNRLYKVDLNNFRLELCEPGKDSLDNCIIEYIKKHRCEFSKHIIISNDKGYDDAFENEDEGVSRRGILDLIKLENEAKTEVDLNNLGKLYGICRIKLNKLDRMRGKYVVAYIMSNGRLTYYQSKDSVNDRSWTFYLDGADTFDNPEDTEDIVKRYSNNNPLVVYVTDSIINTAKEGVHSWFFYSMEKGGENIDK